MSRWSNHRAKMFEMYIKMVVCRARWSCSVWEMGFLFIWRWQRWRGALSRWLPLQMERTWYEHIYYYVSIENPALSLLCPAFHSCPSLSLFWWRPHAHTRLATGGLLSNFSALFWPPSVPPLPNDLSFYPVLSLSSLLLYYYPHTGQLLRQRELTTAHVLPPAFGFLPFLSILYLFFFLFYSFFFLFS